jgi:hypothetical protein
MKVTQLVEYRHRKTLAVLESLRRQVLRGEIRGLAVCAKRADNRDQISVTGDYRDDPTQGATVAMKMSIRLTHLADSQEGW